MKTIHYLSLTLLLATSSLMSISDENKQSVSPVEQTEGSTWDTTFKTLKKFGYIISGLTAAVACILLKDQAVRQIQEHGIFHIDSATYTLVTGIEAGTVLICGAACKDLHQTQPNGTITVSYDEKASPNT